MIATRLELQEMVALLTSSERDRPARPAEMPSGGRGGARRLTLPGGKVIYLRKYLRGGLVRYFVRDRYLLRPERPVRELMVTERARAAGCPVAPVLAVCVEEALVGYRGWIVTEAVSGARALVSALRERSRPEAGQLFASVGRAIRTLHRAGVYHVDLTGHNVLVTPEDKVRIVDFDRAVLARPDEQTLARPGLERFWRSMAKLGVDSSSAPAEEQRRWLSEGYDG